ncbi:hypothetical protein [Arcticibacterium luteifluviistationis]|uniref:Phosphate/sulfate permease n=1 Tax=Arcticibacterium luteifluviistationis TaxID=1784714 RepID=A0A2Z4GHA4_9BACT|nr:hypothetical protein [Arcticibacterium luteifluviistationis]AWW00309.1 hypothetical protein DJ013_19875 [Arcticibacterium luteifluviistationis]
MDQFLSIFFFLLASYSVIANDSIQTLGTWMSSNRKTPWYYLASFAALGLILTVSYSWFANNGDISYGRLEKIPYIEVHWYHGIAPVVLILMTRMGIPVSTSFLILATFASSVVLESMLLKSIIGYGVSAVTAYLFWIAISKVLDEKKSIRDNSQTGFIGSLYKTLKRKGIVKKLNYKEFQKSYWSSLQWVSTGFLWWSWLTHDVANISVFLPRQISGLQLILILVFFTSVIFFIFREGGGKIQGIVLTKTNTKYVRSATIIDFVYAAILFFFKEVNSIPMSTTWVFIGLLTGREMAITTLSKHRKIKNLFPIIRNDFGKLVLGMTVSVLVALAVNYIASKY